MSIANQTRGIYREVEIKCDGPAQRFGRGKCPTSAKFFAWSTAAAARKAMKARGWKSGRRGGIDQCPACS